MKYSVSEITEVIKNRRTIYPHDYSNRLVPRELVEKLLNNAIWAPTHGKTQPWRFKVFMGNDKTLQLTTSLGAIYKSITPEADFKELKLQKMIDRGTQCNCILAIVMARTDTDRIPEIEEIEAVACSVQNMHLTATAFGLGAYWSSGKVAYSAEVKSLLALKENEQCLGFFYIGYPKPDFQWPKGQRKPIEYCTEWM
ncbi:MAG: nitroreductase family protein [Luteibaculaceae bacterium]